MPSKTNPRRSVDKIRRTLASLSQKQNDIKTNEDKSLTGALEDSFPASDPVSSLHFTRQTKPSA
jgi:hypothetical protein